MQKSRTHDLWLSRHTMLLRVETAAGEKPPLPSASDKPVTERAGAR